MNIFPRLSQSGFTLVELTIVASIFAVVGTAVLIALNPVELMARARDVRRLEDAKTLQAAVLRYYSGENCYPWQYRTVGSCNKNIVLTGQYLNQSKFNQANYNFYSLITKEELKPIFSGAKTIIDQELYVSFNAANERFSVCFTPESRAARKGKSMGQIRNRSNSVNGACTNTYTKQTPSCNVCIPQL